MGLSFDPNCYPQISAIVALKEDGNCCIVGSRASGIASLQGLKLFGTDFTLLTSILPGRTRKQIVSKFKKEVKINPSKITRIMKQKYGLWSFIM